MWHVLEKLIAAQRRSVSVTRDCIRQLLQDLKLSEVELEDPLLPIIEALAALEKTVTEDFRSRGQSISDLVRWLEWRN